MEYIVIYDQLKYWLPMASAFALAVKGFQVIKKSIDGWAETLFKNHLNHIQEATAATVEATNITNQLLTTAAVNNLETAKHVAEVKADLLAYTTGITANVSSIKTDIKEHEDKEMTVWQGVVNTLTVLEDRSRIKTPRRRR